MLSQQTMALFPEAVEQLLNNFNSSVFPWKNNTVYSSLNKMNHEYFRHSEFVAVILVTAYIFVFALGIVGNSLVVKVVFKTRKIMTVTDCFIINLAIADFLVIMFCLPATLVSNIVTPWILGLFSCKAVAYLQGVSVCASVTTLVAISIDRFLAICYPMILQITTRGCRIIIATIWIFSLSLALPWTVYFQLIIIGKNTKNDNLYVCREVWPTEQMGTVYFLIANLIVCYLLPLMVFLVCYGCIWHRLCRRVLPGEGAHNNSLIRRSKIKVIKMLFVVVMVFMMSWLPLYAIFIRVKVGGNIVENSLEEYVIQVSAPVAQWFGASNSCVNPLLYAFFNEKLRTGFKTLLFGESPNSSNEIVLKVSSKSRTLGTSAKQTTFSFDKNKSYKACAI